MLAAHATRCCCGGGCDGRRRDEHLVDCVPASWALLVGSAVGAATPGSWLDPRTCPISYQPCPRLQINQGGDIARGVALVGAEAGQRPSNTVEQQPAVLAAEGGAAGRKQYVRPVAEPGSVGCCACGSEGPFRQVDGDEVADVERGAVSHKLEGCRALQAGAARLSCPCIHVRHAELVPWAKGDAAAAQPGVAGALQELDLRMGARGSNSSTSQCVAVQLGAAQAWKTNFRPLHEGSKQAIMLACF
jgi:hypothetical protein